MNIYTMPNLYDAIHKDYNWDIELLRTVASRRSGSVLELASGTGRLTKCILDLGLDYTGLELSKAFLEVSKKKYTDQARFVLGDMCDFKLDMEFNFIFIGFNSFLHNLTLIDAKNCSNNQYLNQGDCENNGEIWENRYYNESNCIEYTHDEEFWSSCVQSMIQFIDTHIKPYLQ